MIRTMVAITALLVLLTGCAGGGDEGVADQSPGASGSGSPAAGDQTEAEAEPADGAAAGTEVDEVLVQGFRFQPDTREVPAGTTVTWTNEDDIEHTATAGTPDAPSGEFDVDLDGAGTTGTHTFDTPGTYAYFCEVHTSMLGEIVVT